MHPLRDSVSYLGRETLRIVLPSPCVVCREELPWSGRFGSCCPNCWASLPRITGARCRKCALPWSGEEEPTSGFLCLECARRDADPLDRIEAWGHYRGGLERLVHALKFERHDFLAAPLAGLLEERWREWPSRAFDAVVPVPAHPRRLRERGFNQAALLAEGLAKRARLRCDGRLLRKVSDTPAQSALAKEERVKNLRRAFEGSSRAAGLRLLLIDDVCTTGSTLRHCADALLGSGAASVSALVLARA